MINEAFLRTEQYLKSHNVSLQISWHADLARWRAVIRNPDGSSLAGSYGVELDMAIGLAVLQALKTSVDAAGPGEMVILDN